MKAAEQDQRTKLFGFEEIRSEIRSFKGYLLNSEMPEQYAVIGGANLVLRGIKEATRDIDMLVSDTLFKFFAVHPASKLKLPPTQARLMGADNESVVPHLSWSTIPMSLTVCMGDGWFPMTYDDYARDENVEVLLGNRLVPLDDVWNSKVAIQRPTDLMDLELIAQATRRNVTDIPLPKVQFSNFSS